MNRPYIICHMVTSIDGKVTGDFLFQQESAAATEIYYQINRDIKSDGFICGRVTMENSFTGGWYPDLSKFEPVHHDSSRITDHIVDGLSGFYAIAFDTNGKLGWKTNRIVDPDGDPGYDGAQIIEILSENVDERYLEYLKSIGISYIFAGESAIDVNIALEKLKNLIGCNTLLLEGGSIINGAFQRVGAVDALSLVSAPIIADADSKPLFMDSDLMSFELCKVENVNGVLVLNYKRK